MIARVVEFLLDRIEAFSDYFIVEKHVTLSETSLFALSVLIAGWIGVFGVGESTLFTPIGGSQVWFVIFTFISILHFISFFSDRKVWRTYAVSLQAIVWCFIASVAVFEGVDSPSVPGLVVLVFTSVFIAVRLYREDKIQGA